MPNIKPRPFRCGLCDVRSTSEKGLQMHASIYHRGAPRTSWQRGWEPKAKQERKRRDYAKIVDETNRPQTAAEDFVGLPWPRIPASPEACDDIAKILGKSLRGVDPKSDAHAVLLSQRDYYLALGARMSRQKATA